MGHTVKTGGDAGGRELHRRRRRRHGVGRQRQAQADGKASVAPLDFDGGDDNRLSRDVPSRAPSPAPSFLLRRAGRVAPLNTVTARALSRSPAASRRGFFFARMGHRHGCYGFLKARRARFPPSFRTTRSGEVLMVGFMNEEALDRDARRRGSRRSSAARATRCGRRGKPPATACRSSTCSWTATRTPCC